MRIAFSPISDGPSATIDPGAHARHADGRGADVVQAVEGVAHEHDAEAREDLDRDPRADQRGHDDVAHRHSSRKASTNRR